MKTENVDITDSLKKKLMSADEAVRLIPDGATVQIAGTALVLSPVKIFKNIGESFLETGHPRDMCIFSYGSPSSNVPGYNYFEYLTHEGLLKRIIGGHMGNHYA
jgi:propionate CoA-transferase